MGKRSLKIYIVFPYRYQGFLPCSLAFMAFQPAITKFELNSGFHLCRPDPDRVWLIGGSCADWNLSLPPSPSPSTLPTLAPSLLCLPKLDQTCWMTAQQLTHSVPHCGLVSMSHLHPQWWSQELRIACVWCKKDSNREITKGRVHRSAHISHHGTLQTQTAWDRRGGLLRSMWLIELTSWAGIHCIQAGGTDVAGKTDWRVFGLVSYCLPSML